MSGEAPTFKEWDAQCQAAANAYMSTYEKNTEVDITGMRKEAVVAALFNGTGSCGMGFCTLAQFEDEEEQEGRKGYSRQRAREDLLAIINRGETMYFDYLHGKRMKLHIGKDVVDIRRYNSGADTPGLGQKILAELKKDPTAFYASEDEMEADPIWQYCHPSFVRTAKNFLADICCSG